jgi:hypothetical protein
MQVSKIPLRKATRHRGTSITRMGIYNNQLKQDHPTVHCRPKSSRSYVVNYDMVKAALTPYAHTVRSGLQPGK